MFLAESVSIRTRERFKAKLPPKLEVDEEDSKCARTDCDDREREDQPRGSSGAKVVTTLKG